MKALPAEFSYVTRSCSPLLDFWASAGTSPADADRFSCACRIEVHVEKTASLAEFTKFASHSHRLKVIQQAEAEIASMEDSLATKKANPKP